MKFIRATLILALAIGLSFQGYVFAEERAKAQDKIIGSMFKGLAKAYVAVTDLDKLKKNNIEELNQMDMGIYKYRYGRIYEVVKDWPLALKNNYKITEQMTREQAIKNIESVDKKKIYEMIDATSDTAIVEQFKKFLNLEGQETQKRSLPEKINRVWNKILEKFNKPIPKNKD
jgi:hypothetical protein